MTDLRYLLDTDTCIYVINHRPLSVRERFAQLTPGSVAMSAVTYNEVIFSKVRSLLAAIQSDVLHRYAISVAGETFLLQDLALHLLE